MGAVTKSKEKMVNDIIDCIHEAEYDWKCSGIQTEHVQELELEELRLSDPDGTVNEILGIVAGYISEVL